MTETYLNGKITVTSLAAPTANDIEKLQALSKEDRDALLNEALEHGRNSGVSDKTVDEIWDSALLKAKKNLRKIQYAI